MLHIAASSLPCVISTATVLTGKPGGNAGSADCAKACLLSCTSITVQCSFFSGHKQCLLKL